MAARSNCFYCREDLSGKKFVRKDEKQVCVRCFDKFCANTCAECRRPVSTDSKVTRCPSLPWLLQAHTGR
uniref:LIM zinc-binding domain-containing protein n=1 Tax=Sinocyclocheilus rhinocerous TaxID=307959 RepID=A0A673JUV1_9TELE